MSAAPAPDALGRALAQWRPGYALPRAFHLDAAIHELELEAIWRSSWLYAGVSAQAAAPGDYFRIEVGEDSIVVVRDHDGALHALHNTCRHRGTPVCSERSGHVRRWVCPYHQWSYDLDGVLLGAGGMEAELDRSEYGLHRAGIAEIGGLIFVFAGAPARMPEDAQAELRAALAPQGIDRAAVAHSIDYHVAANWKLVWQNNRECWH